MSLASHTLFLATPAQALETQRRRHKFWGGTDMTEEEYIQADNEASSGIALYVWVLAPREDPRTLDFKCSCRTFLRTAIVSDFSPSSPEEQVNQVPSYSIASVCTPPHHRGKGYASHMMRLLHWILAPTSYLDPETFPVKEWGLPPPSAAKMNNAKFSVLYSDIEDFYKNCGPRPSNGEDDVEEKEGWVIREAGNTVVWNVRDLPDIPAQNSSQWTWKYLSESEIPPLLRQDDSYLMQPGILKARSRRSETTQTLFTFLPSPIESYQRDRSRMFWQGEEGPFIDKWGIVITAPNSISDSDILAFATWSYELKPSSPRSLVVTRFHISPKSETPQGLILALIARLFDLAKIHRLEQIEVWDIPLEHEVWARTVRETGGRVIERTEHLPAVKWYGKESIQSGEVEWVFNERFAWC